MDKIIQEGKAKITISAETKISKKLPVFYNPVMQLNRDLSVLLLKSINKKNMQIALPLAGTGVRGIRFLLELNKSKIKNITFNDLKQDFDKIVDSNLKLNKIKKTDKIIIKNQDANLFLLESTGFDYIDIDPFGYPGIFLDSAVGRLARDGILAVTATDTSALAGTYPGACMRKYWSAPKKDHMMHETGLRILVRFVQLFGAMHDKALSPILCYSSDHYMRCFFRCEKGKQKVDEIMKMHGMVGEAGPLWLGDLFDVKLLEKMYKNCDKNNKKLSSLLKIIKDECQINTIGFYDVHKLAKKYNLRLIKNKIIINKLKQKGYKASLTHFRPEGIRSDAKEEELINILKD